MSINREEIRHLAELSKLELSDEETEKFQKDAEEIVVFFDKLKEAPEGEFKESLEKNASESLRDEERESIGTGKEKDQFLEKEKEYLKIPNIFEK
ncbi:MAG: Asp-tRNA(Asn)/Glu-tRNA(Gln) amidotransferase subunit GatC [Candidatus Pacebacteria bacterium]|nr:Asp-tRNA(Asn)/Glu-tRNA(Gln) amidotransferase subunit GatC [Candidatus Paceibacterota bacterium]